MEILKRKKLLKNHQEIGIHHQSPNSRKRNQTESSFQTGEQNGQLAKGSANLALQRLSFEHKGSSGEQMVVDLHAFVVSTKRKRKLKSSKQKKPRPNHKPFLA